MDINKLEELARKATLGPWTADMSGEVFSGKHSLLGSFEGDGCFIKLEDAEFVAAANPAAVLDLIALIRKQEVALNESQALVAAQVRLIDAMTEQAAPAAAVVTVDTMEFRGLLGTLLEASDNDSDEYGAARAPFVAHIDAHTAQVVAAAVKQERSEQADAVREITERMVKAERALAAAPQQHDILRAVIEVVRQYPDFDGETLFGTMMDEALAGKIPALLSSIDSLAAGVKPSPQQHAQAAQYSGEVVELAAALEQEWLAKTIAELRTIESGFRDGAFKAGYETALDEIEARCSHDAAAPLEAADSRITGNAQAALSDEQIERIAELHFYSAYAATMDIRLHRFARAILAASQQPAAAPSAPAESPAWTEEDQREQDYFDRHPDIPTPPQEAAARDELISRDNFYADAAEDIAHALAHELEDAELNPGDLVTVNRAKLTGIAKRVIEKARTALADKKGKL